MKRLLFYISTVILLAACGSDGSDDTDTNVPEPPVDNRESVQMTTRSDEAPQGDQLRAGLYMVNYRDGRSDELLADYNYVNNQLMTWTINGWTLTAPIYWMDSETRADFYAYAPYQEEVPDARQFSFCVQTDQTTADAFAKSDFLWGKVEGQSPTDGKFNLSLRHLLSQLTIIVTAEAGFEESELQASDVSVTIGGSKTSGVIDLATGALVVAGEANDVKCLSCGDLSYKAVLLPQQIPFSNLIQINWRGNVYTLQNSFKLEGTRQYSLTIKLKKTKSGFDIGIVGWDIIEEDFGGTIGG